MQLFEDNKWLEPHRKHIEWRHQNYLDQLKSIYEAGMMERDEYNERVAAIEADYRKNI